MLTICSTILRFGRSYDYPAAFNFGDSNSDTGELVAAQGFSLSLPYGQSYFNTPSSGRFSNGRLIVDFISKISNTPYSLFAFHVSNNFWCP
ncbi:GDSL esterase/lipase [Cucumis melo var. makuwa]|uniref:GDSL esterase/lipase n=1 Tax=Cucumis melo var. makuwa TaxID=1194695 RepID=A0A5D3D475_CUCMM|nr:GDSL esterase/lipase [Cucumis melo var. makuwa]TYK18343.1 GDSL esterase/lipase [Cucumis melo var. makuwa]